ncbi:unnamed protein product [Anisakis simplex]|uniref:Protein polybromo-1 (inferred by orthology to a human protein) n=1 Tax=Anisakis simplex TaxID=6269 RepID=A0A0M3K592_ANISI|nr:unnamed protein product [Anisakis simplex]
MMRRKGINEEQIPFSLDDIRINIDKGRYRRLDRFQDDLFALFDASRENSRSDSQIFEDSVELQMYYIKIRDELTRNTLISSARLFTEKRLLYAVDELRKKKIPVEVHSDMIDNQHQVDIGTSAEGDVELERIGQGGLVYRKNDYAYIISSNDSDSDNDVKRRHIMRIERIYKDDEGHCFIRGIWCYRPEETFHLATRKFIENGFDDKDVYVCESRYMGKQLHFKKMKLSQHSTTSSSTENDRLKKLPAVLQKHRVEVCVGTNNSNSLMNSDNKNDENITYYEQLEYNGDWYQLGDFVYVYNPVKNSIWILRIDKMWRVHSDDCYFSGPYFAKPTEIEHEPTRMFYKNELFAIEQPDITLPMLNIQKHCSVLLLKDYQKLRLTEVDEKDVYVVEYKVSGSEPANNKSSLSRSELNTNEVTDASAIAEDSMSESSAKKLKSLKVYHLSSEVLENEIYLFKTPITMEKEMSPLLMHTDTSSVPIEPLDDMDETASESLDGLEHTPGKELVSWLNAQPKISSRSKSGYILFSAEIRKRIMQENPEAGFGEVSKIVGIEWKKLSDEHKKQYETRAEYIANERAKQEAKQPTHLRLHPGQIRVFMCKWQACDFQFDHPDALYEHIKNAHTSKIVVGENQYVCLWTSCLKYRKEGKPFPSLPRLHRHIKEKHLTTAAKSIYPSQRSKNYYTNQQSSNTNNNNNDGTCSSTQQQSTSSSLNFNNNCSNVTNNNNNNPSTTTTYLTVPQSQLQPGTYTINTSHTPVSGFVTQAVIASGSQIVTNGYMNGNVSSAASTSNTNNNGSTLTAYIATTTPHAIVHTPNNSHAYHPYHQVRQVVSNQQPITLASSSSPLPTTTTSTINQQYTAVSIQPINTYQQQPIADPGRTIIQTAKEPVFVAPFNNVHIKRVMHSEAYLKYIESLSNAQQRHISKWNRSISANQYNTQSAQKSLPSNWLKDAKDEGARDEDIVKALWRLRNQLLESTLNIAREFDKQHTLKEVIGAQNGVLFKDEALSPVFCKPKLIPLKSISLMKLEQMQQDSINKLMQLAADEKNSKQSETTESEQKSADIWTADSSGDTN